MNKKMIVGIIVAVVACLGIGIGGYFFFNRNTDSTPSSSEINDIKELKDNGAKVLVVYYSAQNHTEKVAQTIAKEADADIYELEPVNPYTEDDLDWTNDDSRVSKEHNDSSLQNVKLKNTKIDNWDDYDIVLIGYPIWWGEAAWPVNDFVKNNDFGDKTVIPFCTAYSSGIGQSGTNLEKLAKGGNWKTGKRFNQDESDSEVISWVKEMNLS